MDIFNKATLTARIAMHFFRLAVPNTETELVHIHTLVLVFTHHFHAAQRRPTRRMMTSAGITLCIYIASRSSSSLSIRIRAAKETTRTKAHLP